MEKVTCINPRCSREYPKNFHNCPYCGTINIKYDGSHAEPDGQNEKPKGKSLARIALSCVFAFVVLALLSIIFSFFGWNEYVGIKGLICGVSIGAGTWFESWLKKNNFSFGKKRTPQTNKNKPPRRPNYIWIVVIALIIGLVAFITTFTAHYYKCKNQFEKVKEENTIEAYMAFIEENPQNTFSYDARDSVVSICSRDEEKFSEVISRNNLDKLLKDKLEEIRERNVKELADKAYREASIINTVEGWEHYKSVMPTNEWRDADAQIEWIKEYQNTIDRERRSREAQQKKLEEEKALWETEESAWETAYERHNIKSYKKYLKLFPYGEHADAAEKFLIDLEVDKIFAGEHGDLPPMEKYNSTGTSYSILELENRTDYNLTISYSGPDSKRIVIPPHKTSILQIGNGNYRVTASVGHGVIPFAGKEYLDGSFYSGYFYIVTYGL